MHSLPLFIVITPFLSSLIALPHTHTQGERLFVQSLPRKIGTLVELSTKTLLPKNLTLQPEASYPMNTPSSSASLKGSDKPMLNEEYSPIFPSSTIVGTSGKPKHQSKKMNCLRLQQTELKLDSSSSPAPAPAASVAAAAVTEDETGDATAPVAADTNTVTVGESGEETSQAASNMVVVQPSKKFGLSLQFLESSSSDGELKVMSTLPLLFRTLNNSHEV